MYTKEIKTLKQTIKPLIIIIMKTKKAIIVSVILLVAFMNAHSQTPTWRSTLYPENWYPWYKVNDKFLHDFSYAGYKYGDAKTSNSSAAQINVATNTSYKADKTGDSDVTTIIQRAIDAMGNAGGGTVYLPTGIYKVSPQSGKSSALFINRNNVILKGDGPNNTKIFNNSFDMREKSIISIKPQTNTDWYAAASSSMVYLSINATAPSTSISLVSVSEFNIGDRIVLRTDMTAGFIAKHGMTNLWGTTGKGITFVRKITKINTAEKSITLDIPIRYYLKTDDNARIYKLAGQITNSGVENLSIGNRENTAVNPTLENYSTDNDYEVFGKPAYTAHHASAIKMENAENCWVKKVSSFQPVINTKGFHLLSNGIDISQCRLVTIDSCDFMKPQYRGEGGNGYMFQLNSNDCYIGNSKATNARHSFAFKLASSNGNVIYKCTSTTPRLGTDFHQVLSVANLIDNFTCIGDFIDAQLRPYVAPPYFHGHTTSESVIWNTIGGAGNKYHSQATNPAMVISGQFGNGYVIGTQGTNNKVYLVPADKRYKSSVVDQNIDTSPIDHLEGEGKGGLLRPVSLYEDQRTKRLARTAALKTSLTAQSVVADVDFSNAAILQDLAAGDLSNKNSENNELVVYPVPAQDQINVTFPKNIKSKMIVIYNSSGQKVLEKSILDNTGSILINISVLNTGVYTLQLIGEKNLSAKVIKQ